jgi:hypothetical protein
VHTHTTTGEIAEDHYDGVDQGLLLWGDVLISLSGTPNSKGPPHACVMGLLGVVDRSHGLYEE